MSTGTGAAFFDLDRTLLAGASGTVFSASMRAAGMTTRVVPGEAMLYRVFNAVGETLPSMALARQGARFAKGRRQAGFEEAGRLAAPQPGLGLLFKWRLGIFPGRIGNLGIGHNGGGSLR